MLNPDFRQIKATLLNELVIMKDTMKYAGLDVSKRKNCGRYCERRSTRTMILRNYSPYFLGSKKIDEEARQS
jgi:hypothetical protein